MNEVAKSNCLNRLYFTPFRINGGGTVLLLTALGLSSSLGLFVASPKLADDFGAGGAGPCSVSVMTPRVVGRRPSDTRKHSR